jgi:Protein of unknown function (DUF3293)
VYVVLSDNQTLSVRVGFHSLFVDGLLASKKAKSGSFITAWNPFSKSQSAGINAYRNRELKNYVSTHGFRFVAGEGRGEIGEWPPEPSIFAFGRSRAQASAIGRRFRQNAIVHVTQGRPAELIMLMAGIIREMSLTCHHCGPPR